jgi:hypothetical protein
MRNRILTLAALVMTCGILTACNSSSTPGLPGGPTPVTTLNTPTDASGEPSSPATNWDIASVATSRTGIGSTYTQITVTVIYDQGNAFASLVPAGSSGSTGAQLGTVIFFNSDSNNSTGLPGSAAGCPTYPGIDFVILGDTRLADGNFPILNTSFATVGEASVSGSGTTVSYGVPLSAIGGSSGSIAVSAENFSSGTENITDCFPDDGSEVATGALRVIP